LIKRKRIYEVAETTDGYRVLVDRIWPRGMKKEAAQIDLWLKAVAPSTELRKWFGHDPERFDAFKGRYLQELEKAPAKDALARLKALVAEQQTVTLQHGAKNEEQNQALILQDLLEKPE
jgi:uncharacterized protein YeaO (DUF488 family)